MPLFQEGNNASGVKFCAKPGDANLSGVNIISGLTALELKPVTDDIFTVYTTF